MTSRAGRDTALVGVDGGASGVRAHRVEVGPQGALRLTGRSFEEDYQPVPGFEPLPLEEQAAQLRAPGIGALEREQGERWVAAAAACIGAVLAAADGTVRVGIALPGLKTGSGRGTLVVRNGPRVPDYLDRLEARLGAAGVQVRPIERLFGDGECCGAGEQLAEHGLLRDACDAYYLGSGTGVAEALKRAGRLVPLEEAEGFPRAWQLADETGASVEDTVSIAAVNRRWLGATARPRPLRPSAWPEDHLDEDVLAVAALTNLGTATARLVHRRLVAAAERGRPLDRAVVGQRLGQLWLDERTQPFLAAIAERELVRLLALCTPAELAAPYLEPRAGTLGRLRAGLVAPSALRAAPALGAAALALEVGLG